MKFSKNNLLRMLLPVAFLTLFTGVAFAITYKSYLSITPHASAGISLMAGSGNYTEEVANRYAPYAYDQLCEVRMQFKKIGSPTGNITLKLYEVTGSSSNPQSNTSLLVTAPNLDVSTLGTSYATSTFDLRSGGNCIALNSGTEYYLDLSTSVALSNPATNYVQFPDENSSNQSPYISKYTKGHNTGWGNDTNEVPMEFYGATTPDISIDFPVNGSTTSTPATFPYFLVHGNLPAGSNVVFVDYATSTGNLNSSSTLVGSDSATVPDLAGGQFDVAVSVFRTVPLSAGTNYKARARLFTGVLQTATSTDISFTPSATASNNFPAAYYYPTIDDTAYDENGDAFSLSDCSTAPTSTFGIVRGICEVGQFLFIPSTVVTDRWASLTDDLENKPPFGYIKAFNDSFSTTTLDSVTSTYSFPDATGKPFVSDIRTVIGYMLWIGFGFYVFNRFKKFDFHI